MLTKHQVVKIADIMTCAGKMSRTCFMSLVEDLPNMCDADFEELSKAFEETSECKELAYAEGLLGKNCSFVKNELVAEWEEGSTVRKMLNLA